MFNNQIIAGSSGQGGGSFYPYSIDQSLRFDRAGSAHLNFTPASAGNQKTWTWSAWIKRSTLGVYQNIFNPSRGGDGANESQMAFQAGDGFQIYDSGATRGNKVTTRKFRDTSSWYHIVVALDTTDATAEDRVKIYVNGERETLFSTNSNPALNTDWGWNAAREHALGSYNYGADSQFFGGYMAEVNFIDGTALDATSFGETINGIWVPKAYDTADGAYGTNGFYLSFADSAAIGDDLSGNTNDWTANNLAASDVVTDSPTNNFATWNPLDISGTTLTYSEGNLKAERTSTSFAQAYSSFSFDSGKWYAEFLLDTGNSGVGVIAGTTNAGANRYLGQDSFTYSYYFDGRKVNNASYTSYGDSYTTAADGSGDVVGVYIDADNGDIYFSKNGTVQNSGTAAFTGVTGPFRFAIASESNCFHIANFGQDDSFAGLKTSGSAAASDGNGNGVFYDTIGLSGYLAPCSANLPEPTIGPNSTTTSDQNFNTVLYTGNGTGQSITTGHASDFVWLKTRALAYQHSLYDSVRGGRYRLASDQALGDVDDASANLQSFDNNGFTVGTLINDNQNAATYVGWSWKAGGTAVSNTDGSITSSVSVNDTALFSIGTYTGNGTVGATVGHGLGVAPNFLIIKNRSAVQGWPVKAVPPFAGGTRVQLESTSASTTEAAGSGSLYNATNPSSSVITLGNQAMTNTNGNNYVFYAFANVDGHCKSGSYVGNGSADGTFVYTGFRPAWVMVKQISGGTTGWLIYDTVRDTFNEADAVLQAHVTTAEVTAADIDILSNGWKFRTTDTAVNGSGASYIYLAFAESPFKYANAR